MSCVSPAICVCGNAFGPDGGAPVGAIEAQVVGPLSGGMKRARVEVIHGSVTGVVIGDHVALYLRSATTGDQPRVVVPIFQPEGALRPIPQVGATAVDAGYGAVPVEDGIVGTCRETSHRGPLSTDQVANVLLAPNCIDAVEALDEAWRVDGCPDGLGCEASGVAPNVGSSAASLVAVSMLMAVLRYCRRPRR